jgi:hypothetical protein
VGSRNQKKKRKKGQLLLLLLYVARKKQTLSLCTCKQVGQSGLDRPSRAEPSRKSFARTDVESEHHFGCPCCSLSHGFLHSRLSQLFFLSSKTACLLSPPSDQYIFVVLDGAEQNTTQQTLTSEADGYASPPAFPPPSRVSGPPSQSLPFCSAAEGMFSCACCLLTGLLTYHITLFNFTLLHNKEEGGGPFCHLHGKNMFKAKEEEEEFMGNSNIYFTLQK